MLQNVKVSDLEGKMVEAERAISELEVAAKQQLHNLAMQSEQAMEVMQNKLLHDNRKIGEFETFIKVRVLGKYIACFFFCFFSIPFFLILEIITISELCQIHWNWEKLIIYFFMCFPQISCSEFYTPAQWFY